MTEISFVRGQDPPDGPRRATRQRPPRDREEEERDRKLVRAMEDRRKRAWIEAGNELRQPPEYRGRVFDHADQDGVHPTAFPPMRDGAGGELTDEFIAFQVWNQTTYERNPDYYCVSCRIRYNARKGGKCGPCIGKEQADAARQTPLFDDVPIQPRLPEYPT